MTVKIRLARGGAKKRPFYSIVIADERSPRDGRFIEKIARSIRCAPKDDATRLKVDSEKAQAWIGKGASADRSCRTPARERRRWQARSPQQPEEGAAEEEGAGTRRRCCRCSREGSRGKFGSRE